MSEQSKSGEQKEKRARTNMQLLGVEEDARARSVVALGVDEALVKVVAHFDDGRVFD